ncbi:MAG: hypothetical protein ABI053_01150 [Lacisediminihabitans sp.]
MHPFFVFVAAGLATLTVWGFISPRGQWRVLAAWTRRQPYANEPGAGLVALQRCVAGAGIVAMVIVGSSMYGDYLAGQPKAPPTPGAVERMWGEPAPEVVDRVFDARSAAPPGLVPQPMLKYQVMDGESRTPAYLFTLERYRVEGGNDGVGYLGHAPNPGFAALDSADLVVEVRGDKKCIPQQLVVIEDEDTVRIGVYYGQPNPSDGSNAAHLGECSRKPTASRSASVLIPVNLEKPLGKRTVVSVDGSKKIRAVPLIS